MGTVGLFFLVLFIIGFALFVLVVLCRNYSNRCGADYSKLILDRSTKLVPIIVLTIGVLVYLVGMLVAEYGSLYI